MVMTPCVGVAAEPPAPPDATVVMAHGKTRVTLGDIRHTIENNVPPDKLRLFYAERKRISQHAGNVFVVHKLAEEAEARKLTPAEQSRVDEARIRVLSQVQLDHIVAQEPQPDYEAVAREEWQAHPESYQMPEAVHASHVLIAAGAKRDDAAALARAEEVLAKARAGADFAALAKEYSDDPSAASNSGDMGFFQRGQMVKPFEDAAFALTDKGDFAGPVKTQFGYHIIRFEARRAAGVQPFEAVKDGLIATKKGEFRTRIVNREIERIGTLDGVETNYEALMSLYRPVDFSQPKDGQPKDDQEKTTQKKTR
jgi:peptidyl-prolyl cis-trans isomerase C